MRGYVQEENQALDCQTDSTIKSMKFAMSHCLMGMQLITAPVTAYSFLVQVSGNAQTSVLCNLRDSTGQNEP